MTAREIKAVHAIAMFCWGACVAVVLIAAFGLIQAQDAIDESVAQQQVLACSEIVEVCNRVESAK